MKPLAVLVGAVALLGVLAPLPADAASRSTTVGALLDRLPVRAEAHAASYTRDRFELWVDADHDGETTRAEVLRGESSKAVHENARGTVTSGRWRSPYDGTVVTRASALDIDHLVPLEEAWTSGAWRWSATRREAYANDLGYGPSLVAVTLHENRSKGDREPGEWMPERAGYACTYLKSWVAVKTRWRLSVDAAEKAAVRNGLADCGRMSVRTPARPVVAGLVEKPSHSSGGGSSSGGSGGSGGSSGGTDPRYATCTELLEHPNHAPYVRGVDPEYAWYQDRDGDGRVCE